jgi:hypothetical protein
MKVDIQHSRPGTPGFDFRFADSVTDIDIRPGKHCNTLYDLLREVCANCSNNQAMTRVAVAQLYDFYFENSIPEA